MEDELKNEELVELYNYSAIDRIERDYNEEKKIAKYERAVSNIDATLWLIGIIFTTFLIKEYIKKKDRRRLILSIIILLLLIFSTIFGEYIYLLLRLYIVLIFVIIISIYKIGEKNEDARRNS